MSPNIASLSRQALRRMTVKVVPPLCPELHFAGMPPTSTFEQFRRDHGTHIGAAVPYWAVAWPGGQALARWLLDHPEAVAGRPVVDVACGGGLAAVAAVRAGAMRSIAMDLDPNALVAARETAALNGVSTDTLCRDLRGFQPEPGAVLLAGDLWYERPFARLATTELRRLAAAGHRVICADPGRPGRPRVRCRYRTTYDISVSPAFERDARVACSVFELLAGGIPQTHTPHEAGNACDTAD